MKLRCRAFGHRLTIKYGRGRTFVRDGVQYETKPAEPAQVVCLRGCDLLGSA